MIKLDPGFYYHIYNHANGEEDIFKEEKITFVSLKIIKNIFANR